MGNSATKAKNKYNKTVYDQISIKPPKGLNHNGNQKQINTGRT